MAEHRGMPTFRIRRPKPLDPFRPGRHRRSRRPAVEAPAAPAAPTQTTTRHRAGSGRTDRQAAPARAELERRAQVRTPRMSRRDTDSRVDTRTVVREHKFPESQRGARTRQRDRDETGKLRVTHPGARAQLSARRAPVGQPTVADIRSRQAGVYQARPTKATGRAQRPATRLPTADPGHGTPLPPGKRHPQLTGRAFSDRGSPAGGGSFAERFFK